MKINRMVNGQMMEFELTPNEIDLAKCIGNRSDLVYRIREWIDDPDHFIVQSICLEQSLDEGIKEPTEEQIEEIADRLEEQMNDAIDEAFEEYIPEAYQWVMI